MSLDRQIGKIAAKIEKIDPAGPGVQTALDELREELHELQDAAKSLILSKDDTEEDAVIRHRLNEELSEEMQALQERYRFAIRMLELGYGVSERDLELMENNTPEDAFRKLTKIVKQAIAQGDVDTHNSCAYAGTCIAHQTGITNTPCSAGRSTHRGRFSSATRSSTGSILHAACSKGTCFPASLDWIPARESCQ